jgi:4-hydroxy-tetrahydrodipicolinate synthase
MYSKLKSRLDGCFYTIFTPFDSNNKIDFDGIKKYIDYLYNGGARKFYAMAYNSRYSQLTDSEILDLNTFCIKYVKSIDNDNIVIVGDPIHCSTDTSLKFTQKAKEDGADLISLIVREKFFDDQQVLDHYSYIGEKSNFPILVHEMPFLSGMNGKQINWPLSLLKKLKTIPHIVAIKEDAKDFNMTREVLKLEPDIKIIIAGRKKTLLNYKEYGARAYLNGISIIDARIGELFWKAWNENDKYLLNNIISKIEDPFFETVVKKYGWHRCNKAILEAAGFFSRKERMPMPELNNNEFKEIKSSLEEIKSNLNLFFND